jgi:hypothetical protein
LAGLIDSVGDLVEAFGVVVLEAVAGGLEVAYQQHEGDYC